MLTEEDWVSTDNRGVSNTIAVVLLFALAITGALLLVVLSGDVVDQVREQNDMEAAEQSMQDLSNRFSAIKSGGDEVTKFSMPDGMRGDTEVRRTTSMKLTAHTSGGTACTTGDMKIGTLVYEARGGGTVGYEAGGVWRSYPQGGSTMVSPPEINYQNGRLQLSLSDLNGRMNSRLQARLDRKETQLFNRNLSRALFVDETVEELHDSGIDPGGIDCDPEDLEYVTMSISGSQYSTAWYQYASDNYDSKRVTVLPGSSPDGPLKVKFKLGDVREPQFEVNETDLPDTHETNTDLAFAPTVDNVGGFGGETTVEISVYRKGPSGSWTELSTPAPVDRTLSLSPDETKAVSPQFTLPASLFDPSTGSAPYDYRIDISTDDETLEKHITVAGSPADLTVDIDESNTPSGLDPSQTKTITVDVSNTGGLETTRDFEFYFDTDTDGDFDGDLVETKRDVTLASGATETLEFTIPTTVLAQNIDAEITAATADPDGAVPSDTTQISIGDNPYFEVATTPPNSLIINEAMQGNDDIEGTVTNIGGTPGTQTVSIVVRNASKSNNSIVKDANGNLLQTGATVSVNPSNSQTVTLTSGVGIAEPGKYTYTVSSANESRSGSFRVNAAPDDYFLISEMDVSPDPAIQGDNFEVNVSIENAGAISGTQDVDVYLDGSGPKDTVSGVTIDSGDSDTASLTVVTSDSISPGLHDITVETDDTSLTRQVRVYENQSGVGIGTGGNTTITTTKRITASLSILGTALTGFPNGADLPNDEADYNVIRGPVSMHIYTSNASVPNERIYAWGPETDLNTPRMRIKQIQESEVLNKSVTVGPGTELSVFAQSYVCDLGEAKDIDIYEEYGAGEPGDDVRTVTYPDEEWVYVPGSGWERQTVMKELDVDRGQCGVGDSRLNVSQSSNPGNLKILNRSNSKIPNYKEAEPDQRSAKAIIEQSSRVDINSTGHVQLEPDQRLLLYELSEPDAEYENADSSGDPDYNDAVVLFEVVEVKSTVKTAPEFELLDTAGPAQTSPGGDVTFDAKVRNNGGQNGKTDIEVYVDGASSPRTTTSTGGIDGASNKTVPVTMSTTGLSQGIHTVTFQLASNENQTETRNLYIGNEVNPYFVPNVESSPDAVKPGSDIDIETAIANIGTKAGSQNVDVSVVATSGMPSSAISPNSKSKSVTLNSGQQTSQTYTFGTDASETGSVTFEIATENATATTAVQVTEPRFLVADLYVGTDNYDRGDTITSTNLDQLSAVVKNPAPIWEEQDVELKLDTDDDGTYEEDPLSVENAVKLDNNATIVTLDMQSYATSPGVYNYQIATDDDTFEGTIRIKDTPADLAPEEQTESDLISIDMNKIELG